MSRVRFLTVCSYAALITTVIAGCSTQPQAQPAGGSAPAPATGTQPAAAKPAEPVTLTLLIGSTGTPYPATQAVAAEAEKKLNIKIKFDIKPDGTEGDNLVKTRLATGDMADILYYNSGSLLKALNPEENFVDLTKEPFMANLLDSYKETVSSNGKVFGVPGGSSNVGGILYNKKCTASLASPYRNHGRNSSQIAIKSKLPAKRQSSVLTKRPGPHSSSCLATNIIFRLKYLILWRITQPIK